MDSLTHLVLGAAIGEALLGKQLGKKAMLWGALADTIPDLDVFFTPLFSQPTSLMVHRGITHSILFALVMSPAIGLLFSKIKFKRQAAFRDWTKLFAFGMFTHIVLDSFTAYGTGWFEPFSHYRVTFNTIFVADLFYTLPLLVCCIALLFLRTDSLRRRTWNRAGLILSSLYLLFTFVNKMYVDHVFKRSLSEKYISYQRFFSTPTPLNNFLWMGVAEDSTGYQVGYFSDLDSKQEVIFNRIDRGMDQVPADADPESLKILKWFSDNYYCLRRDDSTTYFNDLRFGQLWGWESADAPFAFSFNISGKNVQRPLNRGRYKGTLGENFEKLLKRICGN